MAEALENKTAKKTEVDERWQEYVRLFPTLPSYYFASMEFPECMGNAQRTLQLLEIEMRNISAQFIERETEIKAKRVEESSVEWQDYSNWRVRALRAQRMKENQIKIIQAWIANNSQEQTTTVEDLEKEIRLLRKLVIRLVLVLQETEQYDVGDDLFTALMEPSRFD